MNCFTTLFKIVTGFLIIIFFTNCEENLPSYGTPDVDVTGKLKFLNQSYDVVIPYGEEKPELTNFLLGMENDYNETLDGMASIRAQVEIYLKNGTSLHHIKELRRVYTTHVTLDPGEIFWISLAWYQRDENDKPIWEYIDLSRDVPSNSSVSNPLEFTAVGKMKLFASVPEVEASLDFTMKYIVR